MQISREMTDSTVNLFKEKNIAFVASLMKDGSPQITPVWIDYDGQFLLINTAEGRTKQKNFERDPRIAVSVMDHSNPYNVVTVRGKVV
jgi:PPOX class probable F420-dependent enzyme